LLQLREQTLAHGSRFELMNVSNPLNKIFEITRLNTVFDIKQGVGFFPAMVRPQRVRVAA
jgi:hypothetical protein